MTSAAVRVGKLDGDFVVNPEEESLQDLEMDLIVSGSEDAILMVECGADGVTEAEILDALDIAHGEIKKIIGAMEELREGRQGQGRGRGPRGRRGAARADPLRLRREARGGHAGPREARPPGRDRGRQGRGRRQARPDSPTETSSTPPSAEVPAAFAALEKDMIRKRIAVDKKRPDGRAQDEIRPIETEVDISPRAHGSALFTRGETQILSSVALGTTRMDMKVDNLGLQETKRFWHHYNFPPFSVGEAGFMRGPKRRDIGHGALAERALQATIPDEEDFPYVIRAVSDTLESNGSSSMGSVCASSMALQAAGVPVTAPVAGVAMGLIKEGDDHIVLTDIAGVEDHLGDMDFKVAGTEDGITALQMDIKISGVTFEILRDALEQARQGRAVHPRQDGRGDRRPARGALRVRAGDRVDQDRPREDRGRDRQGRRDDSRHAGGVRGRDRHRRRRHRPRLRPVREAVKACIERIEAMTREAKVGDKFSGKVVKTTTFGAFVELVKGTDGLLHISNVKPGERVGAVEDVLTAGDELDVTVVEVDRERGRIGLRLSDDPSVEGKTAEELSPSAPATRPAAAEAAVEAAAATVAAEVAAAADAVAAAGAADATASACAEVEGGNRLSGAKREPGAFLRTSS